MNGARWLAQALVAEGVDTLFGYPGGTIMPFYDALHGTPALKHVLVRHEQGAAFAANGYARASGRVGVCVATSGPGASNLVTGIADAMLDSVPMVVLTGQVPTTLMGTDAFQELDVFAMTLPMVKHSFIARSVDQLPMMVAEAFRLARSGRPGPVLIDLPKDVQMADAAHLPAHAPLPVDAVEQPKDASLHEALALISQAQRPVLYGGGGIALGDAVQDFRTFVDATQIPTVLTLKGLGALPTPHPLNLGMLGMHGSRAANLAVQECDLLIVVGARFDDRATGKLAEFAPHARVVHMDLDAAEIGKLRAADAGVRGDLRTTLAKLTLPCAAHLHGRNGAARKAWRTQCQQRAQQHAACYDAPGKTVYAPALLKRLSELAPDAVVACDVGQHQMWVAQHWRLDDPRKHLSSGALGAMGFGIPAVMGALDNQALGMVRQWQELFFDKRYSEIDLSDNPDFVAVARAFGIEALHVERADQVDAALQALLDAKGPALLHVAIDSAANVWPLVPPNRSNSEMLDESRLDDDAAPAIAASIPLPQPTSVTEA
jgi:acetolactate synthase-1/2/3 large subunit